MTLRVMVEATGSMPTFRVAPSGTTPRRTAKASKKSRRTVLPLLVVECGMANSSDKVGISGHLRGQIGVHLSRNTPRVLEHPVKR